MPAERQAGGVTPIQGSAAAGAAGALQPQPSTGGGGTRGRQPAPELPEASLVEFATYLLSCTDRQQDKVGQCVNVPQHWSCSTCIYHLPTALHFRSAHASSTPLLVQSSSRQLNAWLPYSAARLCKLQY